MHASMVADCVYLVDYMMGAGMAIREGDAVKILPSSTTSSSRINSTSALTMADKAALDLKTQGMCCLSRRVVHTAAAATTTTTMPHD